MRWGGGESSAHTFLIGRLNDNSKGERKKRDNFLSSVRWLSLMDMTESGRFRSMSYLWFYNFAAIQFLQKNWKLPFGWTLSWTTSTLSSLSQQNAKRSKKMWQFHKWKIAYQRGRGKISRQWSCQRAWKSVTHFRTRYGITHMHWGSGGRVKIAS